MEEEDLVVANPLTISLLPGTMHIGTGFTNRDDPTILRLSAVVLRLAALNFVMIILFRLVTLAWRLGNVGPAWIASAFINVTISSIVFCCGVMGVKSRNRKCCDMSCDWCGFLAAFFVIYVLYCCFSVILLVSIIWSLASVGPHPYQVWILIVRVFLFGLRVATATFSRRLLCAIEANKKRAHESRIALRELPTANSTEIRTGDSSSSQGPPI